MSPRPVLALSFVALGLMSSLRADPGVTNAPTGGSSDARSARQRLRVAPGLQLDLWASEPLLQNLTSVTYDGQGHAYVVETGRRRTSVFDIRNFADWVEDDLALRTPAGRGAYLQGMLATNAAFRAAATKNKRGGFEDFNRDGTVDVRDLEVESEAIRRVWDTDGNGQADRSSLVADGFNTRVSGVAAGILAQGTNLWFTCIPDLWRFSLPSAVGTNAPAKLAHDGARMFSGFGSHIAYGGHDLHGLIRGPDGRIYFTIADRGAWVTNREGQVLAVPDTGAVFRCEPDGSHLEIHARGLRNPQELAFDDLGNLWTGDNNADGGDKARWTLLLPGADHGWTIGWQWLPRLGAWNAERLWHTRESNTAAYLVPPVAHVGHGPAGIAHYPGTGLGDRFQGHFFYADFPGGVRHFQVEPVGAFFRVSQPAGAGDAGKWMEDNSAGNLTGKILWDLSPVDVTFPPFGGLIVADWVEGWEKTGKGRLWHVTDPALAGDPAIREVRQLLAEGMQGRDPKALLSLLRHADQRVRLEAQWELADRGPAVFDTLLDMALSDRDRRARLHALWAIGQIARVQPTGTFADELYAVLALLRDADPEIRAQAARVLGEGGLLNASPALEKLLADPSPRTRASAAFALADLATARTRRVALNPFQKLVSAAGRRALELAGDYVKFTVNYGQREVRAMLAENAGADPVVQYVGVRLLEAQYRAGARVAVESAVAPDQPPAVRLAGAVAWRRVGEPALAGLLQDPDPRVVLEAARAIHDVPVPEALPALAALLNPRGPLLPQVSFPATGLNFTLEEWRTWILRRAANAAFRLGEESHAETLVRLAARSDVPEAVRVEAVEALGNWATPSRRDRIVGLIRPLPPRDPLPAWTALAGTWGTLASPTNPAPVLVAALKSAASLRLPDLPGRFESFAQHGDLTVREAVAKLRPAPPANLLARLDSGPVTEQQAALASLAALGPSAPAPATRSLAARLDQLLAGQLPAALHLDVLEAAAAVPDPVVADRLRRWTNALPAGDPLAAFRPVLTGGNATQGRRLFAERADWGCQRCHKLGGEGGDVGPDLTSLGRTKGREYVLTSILHPNQQIAAGFETVIVTLKDGTFRSGILRQETADTLVLDSPEDGRLSLPKSEVRERERGPSSMPEGLADLMTRRELRDVLEALSQ